MTRLIFPENIEKPEKRKKRKKRKKSGKPLEKGCIPEKRYSPSITSIIRGKYENRPEGAKRPTAGSEAREFTSRAERGRVSPLFQDTSPRWRRHPKDENVSLRAKRSNLFDRDCFVACAPRNDTPSSLMRCHCCSLDRLPLFWNAPPYRVECELTSRGGASKMTCLKRGKGNTKRSRFDIFQGIFFGCLGNCFCIV